MYFVIPVFSKKTLTFCIAFSSVKLCCTAGGALLSAIWSCNAHMRFLIFINKKFFSYTVIKMIPWKDLIILTFTIGIKRRIDAALFERFHPFIEIEKFIPAVEFATFFPCGINNVTDFSVTASQNALKKTCGRLMP